MSGRIPRVLAQILLAAGFVFILPLSAQVDLVGPEVVHPNQRVVIPNLQFVTAGDVDTAAVTKAAFAIALSSSKVKCSPESELESVIEINRGLPLDALASKISSVSCTTNGQIHKVTAAFTPNGAIRANSLVASIRENKPLIVEWKHQLYVLYGVVYDEHIQSSGQQDNVIRQLLLIDPRYSDNRRFTSFVRGKDELADVAGVASVTLK